MQSVITTPHLVSHIFATPLRDHDHATYHHAHHVTPSVSDSDVGTPSLLDTTRHHNRPSPTSKKRGGLRRPFVIRRRLRRCLRSWIPNGGNRIQSQKSKVKSKKSRHILYRLLLRQTASAPTDPQSTGGQTKLCITITGYIRIH